MISGFRLSSGVRIEALNRLHASWRWYYVDADGHCRRVRSPVILLALAFGWRPRRRLPRAAVFSR